jgi:hypothetical protein
MKHSMENFFDWMVKPVPPYEVEVWLNMNNMHHEKIELYGDIFRTLHLIITETYLGDNTNETKIELSNEDIKHHFEWCWSKLIDNFKKENIIINSNGEHRDYMETFYLETYYINDDKFKEAIPKFIEGIFDFKDKVSKSDLEILTELYKLFDKNIV